MYSTRRQTGSRWLMVFVFGLFVLTGLVIFLTLSSEAVSRRIEAVPYYARTYLNKLRPNVEMPAPPAESAIAPDALLETRLEDEAPGQANDTPAYFNEETLNPAQPGDAAEVVVVESSTLAPALVAPRITLSGVTYDWQTWNNCGPATIAMNLSYYGRPETQVDSALFLKPNPDDKNVNPQELASYAQSLGFGAVTRVGGELDQLKQFLSNGFPVIVETWLDPEDNGGLGHYRLFTGYDVAGGYFIAQDSLNGPAVQVPMTEFDSFWQVFNRTYVVVYPPEQAALVYALLGQDMVDQTMLADALATAQAEATNQPDNAFAWFNMGTNYTRLGQPELAAAAFDQARRLGLPYRLLWYQFDIFEAYLAAGRHQDVIELTTANLEATGGLEELYYYRGLARQVTNQPELAADDFRAALDYNPKFSPAAEALTGLGLTSK
jgi:tetratricopeptide (TPR) repeat protein